MADKLWVVTILCIFFKLWKACFRIQVFFRIRIRLFFLSPDRPNFRIRSGKIRIRKTLMKSINFSTFPFQQKKNNYLHKICFFIFYNQSEFWNSNKNLYIWGNPFSYFHFLTELNHFQVWILHTAGPSVSTAKCGKLYNFSFCCYF